MTKIDAIKLRKSFLKYLTQDSKTQDARRKAFNQAIFDDKDGFAIYTRTDLDMVMEKFDRAVKEVLELSIRRGNINDK